MPNRLVFLVDSPKTKIDQKILSDREALYFLTQPMSTLCRQFNLIAGQFAESEKKYLFNSLDKFWSHTEDPDKVITSACLFYFLLFNFARTNVRFNATAQLLNLSAFTDLANYKEVRNSVVLSPDDDRILQTLESNLVREDQDTFMLLVKLQFLSSVVYYRGLNNNKIGQYTVEEKPFGDIDGAYTWALANTKVKFLERVTKLVSDRKSLMSFVFDKNGGNVNVTA